MAVTKPYKFIRFGAVEVTKPYKFIGFGAMDVTKPYKFTGFGALGDPVPGCTCRCALLALICVIGAFGLVRDLRSKAKRGTSTH